jgi:CheY-like chemotaxis protein
VASGEEAVTVLSGYKTKYRALVADINLLGRLNGWEVARRQTDRAGVSSNLHHGCARQRMALAGRSEQRSVDQAVRAGAVGQRGLAASQ